MYFINGAFYWGIWLHRIVVNPAVRPSEELPRRTVAENGVKRCYLCHAGEIRPLSATRFGTPLEVRRA